MKTYVTGKIARFVTDDQSTLLTEQTALTQELLDDIYEAMMVAAEPPAYCTLCGQLVYMLHYDPAPICEDCQDALDYVDI
jgi:hypothetical protein